MVFPHWLSFGGNEIINSARAWQNANAEGCRVGWFQNPGCDTLMPALDLLDDTSEVAPWYDPGLPELSNDFLGLYGLSIENVHDSPRALQVTEKLGDGGQLGRSRLETRRVRVRGFALSRGLSAMEHGLSWLRGALSPDACGQHGVRCGVSDVELLTDCPPERPESIELVESARNLAPNPAFAALTDAGHVLVTNELPDPKCTDASNYRYNGTGTAVIEDGEPAILCVEDRDPGGSTYADSIIDFPAVLNDRWDYSVEIKVTTAMRMRLSSGAYNGAVRDAGTPYHLDMTPEDGWVRFYGGVTVTDAGNNGYLRFLAWPSTVNLPIGEGFYFRKWIVTRNAGPESVEQYFDGDTESETGWPLYTWLGAPDESPSVEFAPVPAVWNDSTVRALSYVEEAPGYFDEFSGSGNGRVLKVVRNGAGNFYVRSDDRAVSKRYVAVAVPASYWSRVWLYLKTSEGGIQSFNQVDAPSTGKSLMVIVMETSPTTAAAEVFLGGHSSINVATFGNLVISEGDTAAEAEALARAYFDGDTEDTVAYSYDWAGLPYLSDSIRYDKVLVPYTDQEYLDVIAEGTRFFHDVAVESGPLILEEHSDPIRNIYGTEVEFTIAVEKPHLYGPTKYRDLPPTASAVVSDVRYNLVPTPRAGRGTPVVETSNVRSQNYMLNPSVETNTTRLSMASAAVTGSNPSAQGRLALSRTSELAAVGGHSALLRLTGATSINSPRSKADIWMEQTSDTIPGGSRIGASVWASGLIYAAPNHSAIDSITVRFDELTSTGTLIETWDEITVTGDDINGYVFESPLKFVEIDGRVLRIRVLATVDWTSGSVAANNSDIRIYADAFSVSNR